MYLTVVIGWKVSYCTTYMPCHCFEPCVCSLSVNSPEVRNVQPLLLLLLLQKAAAEILVAGNEPFVMS